MTVSEQKTRMRSMFDSVAPRYDLLNHLLSMGIDRGWRKRAIRKLELEPGDHLLDVCAGTGDLGFEAIGQKDISVIGVDLAFNMLERGTRKRKQRRFAFVQGDAERLPLPDHSVNHACVGFGIRNCESLDQVIAEVRRVLKPGGRFAVLEFTTPPNRVLRGLYLSYFHHILPKVGGLISGDSAAYTYLPDSVSKFPLPPELAKRMQSGGFRKVDWDLLHGGIACLHVAEL